jgi:hypothetical protein
MREAIGSASFHAVRRAESSEARIDHIGPIVGTRKDPPVRKVVIPLICPG